jgi:hypothetical protein
MLIMSENLLFFVNFLLIKNVGIINNTWINTVISFKANNFGSINMKNANK